MKRKNNSNVSIIGDPDGPTSVFLVEKSDKGSLKDRADSYFYGKRRDRVAKTITPGAHSLEEVVSYLREQYGATEVSKTSHQYIEQKKELKESLIIQKRPDLLGDMAEIQPPEDMTEEAVKQMFKQIDERSRFIESIPDEEMPMDYHVFKLRVGKGRMDIEIDFKWDILSCSYSGNKKEMKQLRDICREIYIYYGVTEYDIQNNTKRYSSLLTTLSSD